VPLETPVGACRDIDTARRITWGGQTGRASRDPQKAVPLNNASSLHRPPELVGITLVSDAANTV